MNTIRGIMLLVVAHSAVHGYTIKNATNDPAQVELTVICQDIDEKYHQNTIDLNFKPSEEKKVPDICWMQSIRAMVDDHGTNKATPVVNGRMSTGQRSGLSPSWIISPAQENQYGQDAFMIQMVP